MKMIEKRLFVKCALAIFTVLIINMSLYSLVHFNGAGTTFGNINENGSAAHTIESYVIEGAGYYLDANQQIQALLNRVELQDSKAIDFIELQRVVDSALENIALYKLSYENLLAVAENTPYNPESITKLKGFNYEGFMLGKTLNSNIFNGAALFLSKGDIIGMFKYVQTNINSIETLLTTIKNEIYLNRLPVLEFFWELNELCAKNTLWGSYAARVFYTY